MKPLPSTTQPILRNSWRPVGVLIPLPHAWQACALPIELTSQNLWSPFLGPTQWIVSTIALVNIFRKLYWLICRFVKPSMGRSPSRESPIEWSIAPTLAEVVGFEPTAPFGAPHFKCGTLTHSDTLPKTLVANSGIEPLTNTLSRYCSTAELIGYNLGAASKNRTWFNGSSNHRYNHIS